MTEAPAQAVKGPSLRDRARRWLKTALWIVGGIAAALILGKIAGAFFPRWWAHRVGDQVNDSIAAGIALGLFYGFTFVALPILVLRWAFRKRRHWKAWAISFGVALVLALPNLLTLGIALGSGHAAHAGERTLDVEAPAFRTSSLIGAIAAVVAWAAFEYMLISRWLSRRRARKLQDRLAASRQTPAPPSEPPAS